MSAPWYSGLPQLNGAKFQLENSIRSYMIPLTHCIEHGDFDQYGEDEICVVKIKDHLTFVGYSLSPAFARQDDRIKFMGIMVEEDDGARYWFHFDASHAIAFKRPATPKGKEA